MHLYLSVMVGEAGKLEMTCAGRKLGQNRRNQSSIKKA